MSGTRIERRAFLKAGALASGAVGLGTTRAAFGESKTEAGAVQEHGSAPQSRHVFNGEYSGEHLAYISFPMGGIGAGMICLDGTGALSKFSLRHRPDLATEHKVFAAIAIKGEPNATRVLEGPVPDYNFAPIDDETENLPGACRSLPRFERAGFKAQFPFATVQLQNEAMPFTVEITGWSPFIPNNADNSSLPVAGLEYLFTNHSQKTLDAVFSFHAENFMADPPKDALMPDQKSLDRVRSTRGGFILYGPGSEKDPWNQGSFAAWVDDPAATVNSLWFRGSYLDALRVLWRDVSSGRCSTRDPLPDDPSPGASIFVPFTLAPGKSKKITLQFAWYVPKSNLFQPEDMYQPDDNAVPRTSPDEKYEPWYAGRFAGIDQLIEYWQSHYSPLRDSSEKFSRTLYDSTLPPEAIEAVCANLCILKSPTVLRQTDGRFWAWEGTGIAVGAGGYGSSTHVWNYAQAVPHLFADLERTLRESEFGVGQDSDGHQICRLPLPLQVFPKEFTYPPSYLDAADGQLGGIVKFYRDWRISGDTDWLRQWWPKIRASIDYCTRTWDPAHRGWIQEAHLTTYDQMLWGPDSFCASLYLAALKAVTTMGKALNEDVSGYEELLGKGLRATEGELYNGEYFIQKIDWKTLRAPSPEGLDFSDGMEGETPDTAEVKAKEGPEGQYGNGCLSDGVFGEWLGWAAGLDGALDEAKVHSHLDAVFKHNFKAALSDHVNFFRTYFAHGKEGGLLVCTWPHGGEPTMPINYAAEVWTGIEYQVASHLIALGKVEQGLEIVRAARRRYDGRRRNPFAETEAGQWYARAQSSYALLQAFTGARYDAVTKTLHVKPAIKGDFHSFLSTATGYGTVGVKDGKPFLKVASGTISYEKIDYKPA